jgi:hypothetical protein
MCESHNMEQVMTQLHPETFDYLRPTPDQMELMGEARGAAARYAAILDELIPEGPDKTYLLRKLREVAMWANIAITRHSTGAPRAMGSPQTAQQDQDR